MCQWGSLSVSNSSLSCHPYQQASRAPASLAALSRAVQAALTSESCSFPHQSFFVLRPHSVAKSNKWPVRLDVHGAVTKQELKAREFPRHEIPGLCQKAKVADSSFSNGLQRVIGKCKEKPLRKSETIYCQLGNSEERKHATDFSTPLFF